MKRNLSLLLALLMLVTTLSGFSQALAAPIGAVTPQAGANVLATDLYGNSAVGSKAAVTSANEYTTHIGMQILKEGGNAVDAAVAMLFANSLTEPGASSLGGACFYTIYLKETDQYICIEGLETVPAAYGIDTLDAINAGGSEMKVTVPGQVHAALTALEKYGTMTREQVLAPVIKLAEEGFDVFTSFEERASSKYDTFVSTEQFAEAAKVFTNDGLPYAIGDHFTNPDFAATLRKISEGGIDAFYKGEIAQTIVDFVQQYGGMITMEDFANYTCVEREPLVTDYRGYTVITQNQPSNGGANLIEFLNILENFDLKAMGYNTPEFLFTFNEAYRLCSADSGISSGDPDFMNLPTAKRVDKAYAKERAALVPAFGQVVPVVEPGDLESSMKDAISGKESSDTTQIAVIDEFGNMVSATMTIGNYFGDGLVAPGTGFPLNSHLRNVRTTIEYKDNPNFVRGGLRVISTMCPSLVVKDGEPVLALGSPGSAVIPPLNALMIIGIIEFGIDPQEAINLPRAFCTNAASPVLQIEDRYEYKSVVSLENCGYTIKNTGSWSTGMGSAALVYIDTENDRVVAASDPRRQYRSEAY